MSGRTSSAKRRRPSRAPLVDAQGFTRARPIPRSAQPAQVVQPVAARQRDLDGAGAARRLTELGDPSGRVGDLLDRVVHRDPAVTHGGRPAQRGRTIAPDVERRPRGLGRLGLEHHRPEVEELTVVLDDLLAPEPLAHRDRLVDPPAPGVEVETHGLPLGPEPAGSDPELQPSARDDVQRGHGARHHKGMPESDVVDLRAEVDLPGLPGQEAEIGEDVEHRHVGRDRRVVLARIGAAGHRHRDDEMLGHPHRLVAQPVRFPRRLDPQARMQCPQ